MKLCLILHNYDFECYISPHPIKTRVRTNERNAAKNVLLSMACLQNKNNKQADEQCQRLLFSSINGQFF